MSPNPICKSVILKCKQFGFVIIKWCPHHDLVCDPSVIMAYYDNWCGQYYYSERMTDWGVRREEGGVISHLVSSCVGPGRLRSWERLRDPRWFQWRSGGMRALSLSTGAACCQNIDFLSPHTSHLTPHTSHYSWGRGWCPTDHLTRNGQDNAWFRANEMYM